uniref:NADH dehydrogenase subunit 4L n=1 Tax=Klapperibrachys cremeri TaxID=3081117 RepID=UPI002A7F2734|nr:NADH dehydrogenase subunit 4L [Klapperibrachys cremeri]WOW99083.1 NADH dehydrogenase subunit 4L [Klapperibrachys cremeri]
MLLSLLIFFSGILSLLMVRKHYLMSLLSLEFLLLSLFFYIFFFFDWFYYDYFFGIIYLVFGVCDGVLGLSLIVYLARKSSKDYLDTLSLC